MQLWVAKGARADIALEQSVIVKSAGGLRNSEFDTRPSASNNNHG